MNCVRLPAVRYAAAQGTHEKREGINMKNVIRKACAAATAAVMLVSTSGCGMLNVTSAYGLYSRSMDIIEEAGGYEADCVMTMTMDLLGETDTTEMSMNYKTNGDNAQVTTHLGGEDGDVVSTTIGDMVYVEYAGTNVKYHIPDDYMDSVEDSFDGADIPQLTEEMLEGTEIVNNDDGTKQISLNLDSESLGSILDTLLGDTELMTFDNVNYIMIFDENDDLSAMRLECDMTMTVMDVDFTANLVADYTFVNFGTAPEITLGYAEDEYIDGGEYVVDDTAGEEAAA